jgi:uncharacterized protein YjiS (DUF1127 family)
MKSKVFESFLLGVTFGIGAILLSLYTRKPDCLASSMDALAQLGRTRETRKEKKRRSGQRLRDMGFSEEEINEIFI